MSASSSHLLLPTSLLLSPFSWLPYLYEEHDGRGRNLASPLVMILLFWIVIERASGFISVSAEMKGNLSKFNGVFRRLLALAFCREWTAVFSEPTLWRISSNNYRYIYPLSSKKNIDDECQNKNHMYTTESDRVVQMHTAIILQTRIFQHIFCFGDS